MKKLQMVKRWKEEENDGAGATGRRRRSRIVRYVECQKNHAANIGGYAVDGCREYMENGTAGELLLCAACGCHRNFHRKQQDDILPGPAGDHDPVVTQSS